MAPTATTEPQVSRRSFLKAVGVGAAATGTGLVSTTAWEALAAPAPALAQTPGLPQSGSDRAFWRKVKNSFMIDSRILYMNVGGTGAMPRHVVKALDENNKLVASTVQQSFNFTQMREQLAPQFGCNTDEMVLTHNTTDGMTSNLFGLDYSPGDEILTTNMEHPAANGPLSQLAARHGVVIRRVELPVGPDVTPEECVAAFEAQITDNTVLICFSHIPYLSGTLLPAKEICALGVERGITTLVDGAHVTGMLDLDFHDMGCDFYAASGHKFQCGPGGTGIWYVRNGYYPSNSNPLPMIWGMRNSGQAATSRLTAGGQPRNIAGALMAGGRADHPEWQALTDSCNYWDEIGRDRIDAYVRGLSAYLKQRVEATYGREALVNPDHPELISGLTTFNPFDDKGPASSAKIQAIRARLNDEYNIVIQTRQFPAPGATENTWSLRISTHLFHDQRDIDTLLDAVAELVDEMGTD